MNRCRLALLGLPELAAAAAEKTPNVVVFRADDLGYGDLEGYGQVGPFAAKHARFCTLSGTR